MTDFTPEDPNWEARCRAAFENTAILSTLSIRLAVLRPGYCELEMPFDPRLTQQDGVLQAGVPAVLADSAGGFAAYSLYPADSNILAVEFKINQSSCASDSSRSRIRFTFLVSDIMMTALAQLAWRRAGT